MKIGQLMMVGLKGPELTSQEADFLVKNNIGGVTLFSRNLETPKQIHKLCSDLQSLSLRQPDKAPLFIAIDMEGGRVHRLKAPFTQWPAIQNLGVIDSTSVAFKFASYMGLELASVGINLDFAPCVDTLTNPDNKLIGDRSISSDPELVAKIASALVRGYIKSGILPCAKHFPGHGNTIVDSHEALPEEDLDLETLKTRELIPFKKAFRARLDLVMTAHIKYKNIDPDWPVTLSEKFISDLIRTEFRYRNLVVTDDLDMKALRNHHKVEEIPVRALQVGCDILLYCNEFDVPAKAIASLLKAEKDKVLSSARIEESHQRVLSLKKAKITGKVPSFDEATRIIAHPDHLRLAKAVLERDIPEELLTSA